MSKTNRRWTLVIMTLLGVITILALTAACGQTAAEGDQNATNNQLSQYQRAGQNIPFFQWSQYRQTLIDIETAQAHGTATTTFFFNMGVANPIKSCPSIGFPVASTSQLTNNLQAVGNGAVIDQMDPNGTYTGNSTGTYVVCVAPNDTPYVTYWEGDVQTEGGAAHWDNQAHMIVLDGAPSVKTKAHQ